MSWLSLIWLTLIFAIFYVLLPYLARGRRGLLEGFVGMAFVMHFTVLLLGSFRLALPGFVLLSLFLWLSVVTFRNCPSLFQAEKWREVVVLALQPSTRKQFLSSLRDRMRLPRGLGGEAGFWLLLCSTYFYSHAAFAAGNLRFLDHGNYSRALSLGVLSAGQPWQIDSSVPLLLPLQILSALSAPEVIRFMGPIVGLLFVLAVAILAFEYSRSRHAALFAVALAMVVPIWRGGSAGAEIGSAELAATFAILSVALVKRSRVYAFLAAVLSLGVSVEPPFVITVLTGLGCAAVAILLPAVLKSPRIAVTAAIALIVWFHPVGQSEGPHQYEFAAQASEEIARTHHRNSWLLISTAEELPFVYGRGWHMPLESFANEFKQEDLAKPSFRIPYQVKDVFVMVERRPLRADASGPGVVQAGERSDMERASVQFAAASLLAAYQRTHNDLEIFSANDQVTIYHLPGGIPRTGN